MDITHDNVCSSMLSCFYSRLLSTGRPISSYKQTAIRWADMDCGHRECFRFDGNQVNIKTATHPGIK